MASVEKLIESSLDRFQESHFHIHSLEQFYHDADPFRWSLNCFIRSLKEIPQLVQMDLQNRAGFPEWFRQERAKLVTDPLIAFLSEKRDFVVHRGMFVPGSSGYIGITEGRGVKSGLGMPIDPLMDSDSAMLLYICSVQGKRDFLGVLDVNDEESMPCVQRIWKLPPFEDEVLDLAAKAWLRVGDCIKAVINWLGHDAPELSLTCRHSTQRVQFKVYDRAVLLEWQKDCGKRSA
jgi:hypothetical protein